MAVRNVYTQAEENMIKETEKIMDEMIGWSKASAKMVATEESIQNMAFAVDRWNPLWRDTIYGANSRWGSIIAFPMYEERFGVRGIGRPLDSVPGTWLVADNVPRIGRRGARRWAGRFHSKQQRWLGRTPAIRSRLLPPTPCS